jgi:dimeric dUTPase (all-alpha-NTP-PPase superfamily)
VNLRKRLRKQDLMDMRRSRVNELYSQGYNQPEIARILVVGLGTVNRDISYFRNQAKDAMKRHLAERVPEEYQKCLTGLNSLLKETWSSLPETRNTNEKIRVLALVLEIYIRKITILADPTLTHNPAKVNSIPNDVNFSPRLTGDTSTENNDVQIKESDRESLEKENNELGDPDITDGVF